MASKEASDWVANYSNEAGIIAHLKIAFDAGREPLLAENRKLREAMREVYPTVEFYLKREIESPSNSQDAAQEAREELNRFRALMAEPTPAPGSGEREKPNEPTV